MKDSERRKVRTRDGQLGWVMVEFGSTYCTVQLVGSIYYKMCKQEDLEDVSEGEFVRRGGYRRSAA